LLLAGIVTAGVVLRFWNLSEPRLTADESLHYFPEMQWIHLLPFSEQRNHPTFLYHSTPPNPMGHPALAIQIVNLAMRLLGPTPEVGRGVMALCGSLLVVLAFVLGRDLYSRTHGLAAAGIASLLPLAVRYHRTLYLDSVYSLLAGGFVWCLFRAFQSPRPVWTVAGGVLLGLAAATKTSAPLLLPFTIGYGCFAAWRRGRPQCADEPGRGPAQSAIVETSLILGLGFLTFLVFVSPVSYVESIRNPADTAYRDRPLAFYLEHLWTRRAWLSGVTFYLVTPPVLIAGIAGVARIVRRCREARYSDAIVILWLVAMSPLLLLHLAGLSGEHGYLSFVLPGALLAAVGVEGVPRRWRTVAWVAVLAAMIPAAILYGHRVIPAPYDSYLDGVDRQEQSEP
jgi:4-amino-4-deoxy-L-arabinose transferase-like glycosyltransferase